MSQFLLFLTLILLISADPEGQPVLMTKDHKVAKHKIVYMTEETLQQIRDEHIYDVIYAVCSSKLAVCDGFTTLWVDLSLYYTKDNVLFGAIDSTMHEDVVAKYHIRRFPFLIFFPACPGLDPIPFEYKVDRESVLAFLDDNAGLPCLKDEI